MTESLTLDVLKKAVTGHAAAFRCVTEYQPAGGPADKVFPPTYEGGKYAVETRMIGGQEVQCVLLNSVQSEANHMELALRDAWEEISDGKRRLELPVVRTTFKFEVKGASKTISVTSLDAPHRVADAIFRDSFYADGSKKVMFRKSSKGKWLDVADVRNATGLFEICPTALVFGLWDSAGPRGGLGAKFQRALVSEMVGVGARLGVTTGGKVDHLNILIDAGTLYQRRNPSDSLPEWTLDKTLAIHDAKNNPKTVGKQGKPSEANLGGVTPDFAYARDNRGNIIHEDVKDESGNSVRDREKRGTPRIRGGFSVQKAVQATVLSLIALRRLRFPLNGDATAQAAANQAAHTALAALGLCAAVLAREQGADLRSRCQLFPTGPFVWELLDVPGQEPKCFHLDADNAVKLFNDAVGEAIAAKLPWEKEVIELVPSDDLLALVRKSHEIAAQGTEGDD